MWTFFCGFREYLLVTCVADIKLPQIVGQSNRNSRAFSDGAAEDLNTITSDIAAISEGDAGGSARVGGHPATSPRGPGVTRSSTTTEDSSESHHNNDNADTERRTIDAYVDFSYFNDRWHQQPDNVRRRVAHILNRPYENGDVR